MDILDESSSVTNSILKGEVSGRIAPIANASTRLNPAMLSYDPRPIGQVETKDHMEKEIWSCSQRVNNVGVLGEMSDGLGSYSIKNVREQQFGSIETGYDDMVNVNDFTFPSESELHKALGSAAYRRTSKSMSKYISVEDTYSSSTLMSNKVEHDHIKGLELPKEVDPEYLLDAVVGNLLSGSDDTSSIFNSAKSPISRPVAFTGSIHPKINSEESTLIMKNSDLRSKLKPAVTVKRGDDFTNQITSPSFDGNSSLLIDEAQEETVYSRMQPTSGPKISSICKKRARPGTTQRSRPRDRQLIMDRMKELRELVPDGGRVSLYVSGPKLTF